MTAKKYYNSTRMVETRHWTLEMTLAFAEEYHKSEMVDKKYTEEDLHTILKLRKEWYSHTDKNVVRDYINSLNKQDNEK